MVGLVVTPEEDTVVLRVTCDPDSMPARVSTMPSKISSGDQRKNLGGRGIGGRVATRRRSPKAPMRGCSSSTFPRLAHGSSRIVDGRRSSTCEKIVSANASAVSADANARARSASNGMAFGVGEPGFQNRSNSGARGRVHDRAQPVLPDLRTQQSVVGREHWHLCRQHERALRSSRCGGDRYRRTRSLARNVGWISASSTYRSAITT